MKPLVAFTALAFLMACQGAAIGPGPGAGGLGGGKGYREFLVLGSKMSFEQCRARGGLIIKDQGSPMVACDPRVLGKVVPADEFDHPGAPAAAEAS